MSIAFIAPNIVISKNLEESSSIDRAHVTIYVDTSGIDRLTELNATEKAQLKKALIAHIWANFNESVGSENVTVTNDPDQAENANRTINIYDQTGGTIFPLLSPSTAIPSTSMGSSRWTYNGSTIRNSSLTTPSASWQEKDPNQRANTAGFRSVSLKATIPFSRARPLLQSL